jgi:hypothetical protein
MLRQQSAHDVSVANVLAAALTHATADSPRRKNFRTEGGLRAR